MRGPNSAEGVSAASYYSGCLSLSTILGPGDVFVIEVLDPLVQEGMSALVHLRLHILCLFQPLFFLERTRRQRTSVMCHGGMFLPEYSESFSSFCNI